MLNRNQTLGLVALTLMWGVNWPVMKLSLQELSPLYFRALTMTGGALWLFAFYRQSGVRLTPQASEWRSQSAKVTHSQRSMVPVRQHR